MTANSERFFKPTQTTADKKGLGDQLGRLEDHRPGGSNAGKEDREVARASPGERGGQSCALAEVEAKVATEAGVVGRPPA